MAVVKETGRVRLTPASTRPPAHTFPLGVKESRSSLDRVAYFGALRLARIRRFHSRPKGISASAFRRRFLS